MAIRRKENTFKGPWELKVKPTKLPKGRENAGDQVVIGLSFASDWLREKREFSRPITDQIIEEKKKKQSWITFDTIENCPKDER